MQQATCYLKWLFITMNNINNNIININKTQQNLFQLVAKAKFTFSSLDILNN